MLYSFGFLPMFYNKFEKILYIGRSGRLSLETFLFFQKPKPRGGNRNLKLTPPLLTIVFLIFQKQKPWGGNRPLKFTSPFPTIVFIILDRL